MGRVLIVPDVHGRKFWESIKNESDYDEVVFLGDYLDPYPQEKISPQDANNNLDDIMEWADGKDNVTFLLGNHDLGYINSGYEYHCGANRNSHVNSLKMNEFYNRFKDKFKFAWEKEINGKRYLLTHAGVLSGWYDANKESIGELSAESINEFCSKDNGVVRFGDVSYLRGGMYDYGGPSWADVREHADEESLPIDGFYQVFGHTQVLSPIITENFSCIDCRKVFVLSDDGNISPLNQ